MVIKKATGKKSKVGNVGESGKAGAAKKKVVKKSEAKTKKVKKVAKGIKKVAKGIKKVKKVAKIIKKVKKVARKTAGKNVQKNMKKASQRPTKVSKSGSNTIEKVSTGIVNLDKITEGGLGKNSTNLLVGGSGNGKSIFATQFLMEGVRNGETVLYVAFEEKKKEFYANMLELGWDLEKAEKSGKFFFLSYTPEKIRTMLEEGGGDIETLVLTKGIKRIAIDSITAFVMLFDRDVDMREKTLALFSLLRSWTCTSLLIYERDPLIDKKQSSRILEFEADSLILLYFTRIKKGRERFLEIYKMRGTNHSTNIFPYSIRSNVGIDVSAKPFPGNLDQLRAG
jgi:circadian clock protein KaiC